MNKAYSRIRWENLPSIATPLNESNLNRMDVALNEVDDRVISLETTKLPKTTAYTMVKDVSFNESTGVFTITKLNGSQVTINTALEKVTTNFRFDRQSQKLILTLADGTTQEIDLSAFITQYEFLESDTITFNIDANGKVTAIVKEGSIEEKHLQPNYLAGIKVEVAKAEAGSSDAKNYADLSRKYAIGTDEITWTKSTDITGSSTHITGVAFDGFKFVAINPDVFQSDNSSQTTYLYSLDGKSWERKSWSYGYMLDIAYGNGNYVAVGGKGEVFYSSDGITWERSSAGTADLISVAYSPNNKAFVAIEYQTGKMYISENKGVTWSQCASYPSESFNDIVYGATSSSTGKFVAVGDNSIYWSNNGYGWTSSSGYSGHFYVVTYGDGKFVALGNGNAYYSENGISWSAGNGIDGMIYDVTYGNGMFVAIGLIGATYVSLNGIDWKMKYSADSTFSKLTYGNGVFVGVNGSENIYYFDTSILNYSSKGYYERTKNVASTINDFIDMASEHEKNAKNSADLALIYSEDANQSASNANYHSINARNSATNASISATNASNSATNASNYATSANQSAENAENSAQRAEELVDTTIQMIENGDFTGPQGPKGDTGESGVITTINGFFTLSVDEDGNLWVSHSDSDTPPNFEYDSETGNLYLVTED